MSDNRIDQAMRLHLEGRYAESEALYRQIIAERPDAPEPKHYLGFLLQQTGRFEESLDLVAEALRLDASHPQWHYNHGIALAKLGRNADAIESFLNSLRLDPRNYFCWTNLGSLYEKTDEPDKAEQAYTAATGIDPECPDAYYLLSTLFANQGRFGEAKYFNCRGFISDPAENKSRIRLGIAYHEVGRSGDAVALMESWLEKEPENAVAMHMLTAFRGLALPERCTEQYVESAFDAFASGFDAILTSLKYAGPRLLEEELQRLGYSDGSRNVLDLGCGTGLSGAILRRIARTLTGVDLSRAMLEKAEEKRFYDRLFKSEICEFLSNRNEPFDLIACMDTLIYFGNLEPVFEAIHANLEPRGMFIFTTETCDSQADQYELDITGRFRHRPEYVAELLNSTGFGTLFSSNAVIRHESGHPVHGQFFSVQKPG